MVPYGFTRKRINLHIVWNHANNEDYITLGLVIIKHNVVKAEQDFKSLWVFTGIYRAVEEHTLRLDCDSSQIV